MIAPINLFNRSSRLLMVCDLRVLQPRLVRVNRGRVVDATSRRPLASLGENRRGASGSLVKTQVWRDPMAYHVKREHQ
jgi:hypothetical protein